MHVSQIDLYLSYWILCISRAFQIFGVSNPFFHIEYRVTTDIMKIEHKISQSIFLPSSLDELAYLYRYNNLWNAENGVSSHGRFWYKANIGNGGSANADDQRCFGYSRQSWAIILPSWTLIAKMVRGERKLERKLNLLPKLRTNDCIVRQKWDHKSNFLNLYLLLKA